MRVSPVLQPFEQHVSSYEAISDHLGRDDLVSVTAVVAWARLGGLRRLESQLRACRSRNVTIEVILGIDEGGASVEGLALAQELFDSAVVLYDSQSGTFHPKLWLFDRGETAALLVGSFNLTAGGLYYNYEAGLSVDLDLSLTPDRDLYRGFVEYVNLLRSDKTSRSLESDLIDLLRDSAGITLKDEGQRSPSGGRRRKVEGHGSEPSDGEVFGRSQHKKKRDPLARGTRPANDMPKPDVDPAGKTPLTGAPDSPVVYSWSKRLTRSDCGRPNLGSNTTAALRFTKFGHDINQEIWFREELFDDAEWVPDNSREGRERAIVRFDVVINGAARGTHDLELKYDQARQAGQGNFTTDLKWGSLSPVLRENDLVGEFVYIDKHEDGSLKMTISPPKDLT